MESTSGISVRIRVYLSTFVLLELTLAFLLRWDTEVVLSCPLAVQGICLTRPAVLTDAGVAILTATALAPILALVFRRLWSAAPVGFGAHAVAVPMFLLVLPGSELTLDAIMFGVLDVAISVLAVVFALGVGPPPWRFSPPPATTPYRGRIWHAYSGGRPGLDRPPARAATCVAIAFGISATFAALIEFGFLTSVTCVESCLPPLPPWSSTLEFGAAVVFGLLPVAAASDRRMSPAVVVGFCANTAATFLWLSASAPEPNSPGVEVYLFAFFGMLWLLLLTAIFHLVLPALPVRPTPATPAPEH